MSSVIYYDNKLIGSTITLDSTTGGSFAKCFDGRTSTQAAFTGTELGRVSVLASQQGVGNYVAIAKHNMGTTGAALFIQTSASSTMSSPTTICYETFTTDDVAVVALGSFTVQAYLQVTVTGGTGTTYISDVSIGQKLSLPSGQPMGYMPPKFAYNDLVINSTSQGADLVGSIRIPKPKSCKIDLRFADESWFNTNWPPFVDHLPRPFYFVWDEQNRPDDAAFVWIKKKYPQVKFGPGNYQQATIDGEGIT